MIKTYGVVAIVAFLAAVVGLGGVAIEQAKREAVRAAVSEERRARTADAIELIRESDKSLDVNRKATNADLCRGMGGKTIDGVCQ